MNKGIDVEIIKDSTNWTGKRLTTFVLKYPRYIHSELMTHRVFSKNSASSRAIPILKMIDNISNDPVMPIWTLNKPGMQGDFVENEELINQFNSSWLIKMDLAFMWAKAMSFDGVHKQNVNRLLEPWMHIKIILTGTDFDNWYELRNHPDAQPEIQELAKKMLKAQSESVPQYLNPGEWHIPFSDDLGSDESIQRSYKLLFANTGWKIEPTKEEMFKHGIQVALNMSVARCARISYNNVDGSTSTLEKDLELFHKLITSKPLHASPAEHQAQVPYPHNILAGDLDIVQKIRFKEKPWEIAEYIDDDFEHLELVTIRGKYFSNLQGWIQYRKILEEQFKNK